MREENPNANQSHRSRSADYRRSHLLRGIHVWYHILSGCQLSPIGDPMRQYRVTFQGSILANHKPFILYAHNESELRKWIDATLIEFLAIPYTVESL